MLAAARWALESGCACAPVSGFHHAGYDYSGGFCTFNGLCIAARRLLEDNAVRRLMILDCDMHYGDGTEEIIKRLHLEQSIDNATFGRWFHAPAQANAYLDRLRETVTDAYPKKVPEGYVCRECLPEYKKLFVSREALWADHLFEALLNWCNEKLARAQWLVLEGTPQEYSYARLAETKREPAPAKGPEDRSVSIVIPLR